MKDFARMLPEKFRRLNKVSAALAIRDKFVFNDRFHRQIAPGNLPIAICFHRCAQLQIVPSLSCTIRLCVSARN
jgi:hypothetical protein